MVCDDISTIWLAIFIITGSIMILTNVAAAIMFINVHNQSTQSESVSPILGRSGTLSFITITLTSLIIKMIRSVEVINIYCNESKQNVVLNELNVVTHSFQYALLLIIFFTRTKFIFRLTAHKLSKNTSFIFYLLIILYIVLEPVTTILPLNNITRLRFIISGIKFISLIVCVIILTVLFISKLVIIGKSQTNDIDPDDSITKLITKTAILGFISIFFSI
eukprot:552475_1